MVRQVFAQSRAAENALAMFRRDRHSVETNIKRVGDVSKPMMFIDFLYEWVNEHPHTYFDHQGKGD